METKHTAGPWKTVGPSGGPKEHAWHIHQQTATIDGGYFCRVDSLHWTKEARETAEANALLIAAAPELLEALQTIDRINRNDHSMTARTRMLGIASAAISKATGQTL